MFWHKKVCCISLLFEFLNVLDTSEMCCKFIQFWKRLVSAFGDSVVARCLGRLF